MKLPIRATRPIEFKIPERVLYDCLRRCQSSLVYRKTWDPGELFLEKIPLDLVNVKGTPVTEVTFRGEIVSNMFANPGSAFEFYFNRETNSITLSLNSNLVGVFYNLRPLELKNLALPLFVHELTHLLDHKTLKDARKQEKYENLKLEEKLRTYYNLDIEVRAYLKQICFQEVDRKFGNGIPKESIEEIIKSIKNNREYSQLLDYLTETNRKKILKGLVTRYQDLSKNEGLRREALASIDRMLPKCVPEGWKS